MMKSILTNNKITKYGFCCGYVQHKEISRFVFNEMYMDNNIFIVHHINLENSSENIVNFFESKEMTKARDAYNKLPQK